MKFHVGQLITDTLNPSSKDEWRIFKVISNSNNRYHIVHLKSGNGFNKEAWKIEDEMISFVDKVYNKDLEDLINEDNDVE